MNRRANFIGFLFLLPILLALMAPFVEASEASFVRGQVLNHNLSVCLDKADAVAIIEADEKDGRDAANAVWMAADRCLTVPVQGPLVGKVVKSAKVVRDGQTKTARAVEIVNDGVVIGYFLTTAPMAERNS
jgi:hypothetical protein